MLALQRVPTSRFQPNFVQKICFREHGKLALGCMAEDENSFLGGGRMHVERKRCNQSDLRKKGEFEQINHKPK